MATLAEKHAKYQEGVADFWEKIKSVGVGVLKGATTDLVGAPVDILNEVIGAVSGGKLKSAEPVGGSKNLRRTLGGDANVEDKNMFETAGTLVNPETVVKAMIVGAAKFPERYNAYTKLAIKEGSMLPQAEYFNRTGVYYDKDSVHKTTLSDADAKINHSAMLGIEPKLGDVLIHPELYKLYPELKNIRMSEQGARGSGSMAMDNSVMTVGRTINEQLFRDVVLHETQHAVQHIERFAPGGNTRQFLSFDPVSVQEKINRARKSGDVSQVDAANRAAVKLNQQLQEATNRYMNIPGEQEARFTTLTGNMSEQELGAKVLELLRKGETPQTTFTVPIRPIP
jgi:hypothetical protein